MTATFDPRGLLSVLQNGVGVSSHYAFDGVGNWLSLQDGRNFFWTATYDKLGQVIGTSDPINNQATYAYTPTGMTKSVQDAKGNFTTYGYTTRDEVKSRQNMIGAYNTYTYNALGNPSMFTDRMSRVQTFTFDRLSRLTYLAYTDSNATSLSYDGLSRVSGMQDATGVRTYSYDAASRVTGVVYPTSIRLSYGYDANDNRTSLQALSQTTSYSYNSRDLLSSQVNGLNERTTYAYDGEGRENLRQTANGVRVSTSYDNNGGVSLKQYWNSANAALAIYSGSYTRREQLSLQAELGTYPASYTYYANYQLGHDYRGSEQVNNFYDGVGNLSSRDNAGTTNYTYNSLNQMVTAVTGSVRTTLAYDLEGNLVSEIAGSSYTTYTYDALNRLTLANKDGTSESYIYSADGLRQQKTASGSTIDYVWDGQNVLVETNTSLVVQVAYVDYPGIWGGLVSQNRSGTSNWYGFDLEGNTRILVSIGGTVTDSYSYRAFGEETAARGSTVNAYRFGGVVGYYRDSATRGYLRQRHYRSDLSRFMSQDPIGFAGGDVNLYRYVGNDPTNFGDPSGLWDWRRWYMNGMGGLSGWVDTYLMFGSTENFGRVAGEYDSGQASGWQVGGAAVWWGGNLAVTAFSIEAGSGTGFGIPQLYVNASKFINNWKTIDLAAAKVALRLRDTPLFGTLDPGVYGQMGEYGRIIIDKAKHFKVGTTIVDSCEFMKTKAHEMRHIKNNWPGSMLFMRFRAALATATSDIPFVHYRTFALSGQKF